jgi:hypothetical protein
LGDFVVGHDDLRAFVLSHAEILSGRHCGDRHRDAVQRPVTGVRRIKDVDDAAEELTELVLRGVLV